MHETNNKASEHQDRLKKLEELKKLNINPYPAKAKRTHVIKQVLDNFNDLEKNQEVLNIVGRLRGIRVHGNIAFANLQDQSGTIQIVLSKRNTENTKNIKNTKINNNKYKIFTKLIDIGDFIEVQGNCFLTKKCERSVMVKDWKLLTKTLRPLPDKWHGLKDEDKKFRKRYLDILFNPGTREIIEKKAKFWNAVREFHVKHGFLEVETPVLEITTGGADAAPFATHHNALDIDVYLRISAGELWQKRLMVAGFEKTFEIGRIFRNEGMDVEHLQDYTQMEFYWAYADYKDGMDFVEKLYKNIAQQTFNTLKFKIKGFNIDLGKKWECYDYVDTIKKMTEVDILKASLADIEKKLQQFKIKYSKEGFNITRAIDNLWKYCRKNIGGPGFLINMPVIISPLAKSCENNLKLTQRFQPIIAGTEMGNGYSELNDPIDQAERFGTQQALREAGDTEAQMQDSDFVEALEYGMPPVCGFGFSERLFSFLMDKPIRECQTFPLMKPKGL
ncbi:MAG: lysine--tRNA ligase [Patescibacteria group bacterium]|nr:lysine--tRNA ligase [Patescibacteria group bacterium]MBU1987799.1 lysine--tRNA ligase [Patescibacteria group bacterium]MBU2415901.1 lysine--tRNA ligase [Patescibacteria group bacterium]MBU2474763.1 lysine--tRNA ligase [Patescibacteria group bacterium]